MGVVEGLQEERGEGVEGGGGGEGVGNGGGWGGGEGEGIGRREVLETVMA